MANCRDRTLAVGLLAAALVFGPPAVAARADGDPASDVLATQPLFLPADAGVSGAQAAQLAALLAAARRARYPIRVAVVASRSDLGSITELWRLPRSYARFLAAELTLTYRGRLLVVMPDGYGSSGLGSRERAALAGAPAPGGALGTAALNAVQRLARAAGHRLAIPRANAAAAAAGSGSTDAPAWVAFVVGAAAIALAWSASIRARPVRARRPSAGA